MFDFIIVMIITRGVRLLNCQSGKNCLPYFEIIEAPAASCRDCESACHLNCQGIICNAVTMPVYRLPWSNFW